MPDVPRRGLAHLLQLCCLVTLISVLLAGALRRSLRVEPRAVPLVLVLVPHLGAADLRDRLHDGDLPRDGIRRLAFTHGFVVRRLRPVEPATTTAMTGALLSRRMPHETGVTTALAPVPSRRCTLSRAALTWRALRRSILRARPLRPTLSAGLEPDLLPRDASRWEIHRHGDSQTLPLDASAIEDPFSAGWRLSSARATERGLRGLSIEIRVPGDAEPEASNVVDLLLRQSVDGALQLVDACRTRDELAGRLRRCGGGHVVQSSVECVESGLYHERANALLEVADGEIRISAHTHPWTTPPMLAARLNANEVHRAPGGGRWTDGETIAALGSAVALGEHERLVAVLAGPRDPVEIAALDKLLGELARAARAAGGALVVVGLTGGYERTMSIDLPLELPALLPPDLATRVRVHVEESHARVDLCRPTRSARRSIEDAILTLVGSDTRVQESRPGVLLVTSAPGVDLGASTDVELVAGRPSSELAMAGAVFAVGSGVPRLALPEMQTMELSWLLGELWRRGPGAARWPP